MAVIKYRGQSIGLSTTDGAFRWNGEKSFTLKRIKKLIDAELSGESLGIPAIYLKEGELLSVVIDDLPPPRNTRGYGYGSQVAKVTNQDGSKGTIYLSSLRADTKHNREAMAKILQLEKEEDALNEKASELYGQMEKLRKSLTSVETPKNS